jgi:hypothetical protein
MSWGGWKSSRDCGALGMTRTRRAKVCEDCRKIILLEEDLVQRRGEDGQMHTYCADCAAKRAEEDDAGEG